MSTPMDGVVLQTYGAGNAPSNIPDIFKAIDPKKVIVVNITQCTHGFVDTSYATGKVYIIINNLILIERTFHFKYRNTNTKEF